MRVVLIRLFRLQRLLHIACIQMQSRVQCVLSNGLRKKLLNYKDVRENICVGGDVLGASRQRLRQELDIWICPLCLWFFTVWAKTGNLANLFGCCATDSTLIARLLGRDPFNQNFRKCRSKTQWIGSVQPEKFRKNRSTFWGGPLFPVGPVWILVEWIAPLISLRCWSLDLIFVGS